MSVTYVVGAPGSGKSTYCAKLGWENMLCKKAIKRGMSVYSMTPIKGTYQITKEDIGIYDMSGGLLLCDEAGLQFSNRNWKQTPWNVIEHFKLHRHYHEDIYIFSQECDDVDNKLIGVSTRILLISPLLQFHGHAFLSVIRWIGKRMEVDDKSHKLISMDFKRRFWFKFIYLPRWWCLFDSFDSPQLLKKQFHKYGEVEVQPEADNTENSNIHASST